MPFPSSFLAFAALATLSLWANSAFAANFSADFEQGGLPTGWTTDGQIWCVASDPDKPANHVLAVNALNDHVAILTISSQLLGDGLLSFRTRFETPYPSVVDPSKNDGKHFPHWRLNLMPKAEGSGFVFTDNHVWNTMGLSQGSTTIQQSAGQRPQSRWINWTFTFMNGLCIVRQDNVEVLQGKYDSSTCSGLSFVVMHAKLFLDDISFKP